MNLRSWLILAAFVSVLHALAAVAAAQPKAITKDEYERAFEKASATKTYPYREKTEFKSYTYYDSPQAIYADEGEAILSQVAVTEYAGEARLRTSVTTETAKGKTVVQLMQIDWKCYALSGNGRWKKAESCNVMGLTGGMSPQREEYSVEGTILNGTAVQAFRRIEITGSDRIETGFFVDAKGRIVRREDPDKTRAYEYGVKIKPVVLPGRSAKPRPKSGRRF